MEAILAGLRGQAWSPDGVNGKMVGLSHAEAAVHATVREIEAWLRSDPVEVYRVRLADEVARRFGGTT